MNADDDSGVDLSRVFDDGDEPTELEPTAQMQRAFVMQLVDQLKQELYCSRRRLRDPRDGASAAVASALVDMARKTVDELETRLRWIFNRVS